MTAIQPARRSWVELLAAPHRAQLGMVSVDDAPPVPLACFVLENGDVLIPTGESRSLELAADRCPVRVEFTRRAPDTDRDWVIVAAGLGRPLTRRDEPAPLPYTSGALALLDVFRHGIRVCVERIEGRAALA